MTEKVSNFLKENGLDVAAIDREELLNTFSG